MLDSKLFLRGEVSKLNPMRRMTNGSYYMNVVWNSLERCVRVIRTGIGVKKFSIGLKVIRIMSVSVDAA